ncbi:hypothetical protein ANO11243_069650 [Dothideomycetidae sp. 11243]|nr:hypothetical protein ANO11243_069650 [fungal sp. No.11243]
MAGTDTLVTGLSAAKFAACVTDFHQSEDDQDVAIQGSDAADIFLSVKPPRQKVVVDSTYLESTWTWISDHRDIFQKRQDDQDRPHMQDGGVKKSPTETSGQLEQNDFLQRHLLDRLHTTEERIWHTVAGHGVDWRKLPKLEFQCLCIIAGHGPSGVLQPDVVVLTGQDKRSVPRRTDILAIKGYITKEPCQGGGSKTSLLRLKKFSVQDTESTSVVKLSSNTARIKDSENLAYVFRYSHWYDTIMQLLKEQKDGIPYDDLRRATGVSNDKIATRGLNRCMWRLAECGLVERYHVSDHLARLIRYVRLIREPTQMDRDIFMASVRKTSSYSDAASLTRQESADGVIDKNDGHAVVLAAERDRLRIDEDLPPRIQDEKGSQALLLWNPDTPITNVVYDVVESFGIHGATSTGTVTHYTFRSLSNFEKAVKHGHASWDYILADPSVNTSLKQQCDSDEWGFRVISPSEIYGSGNSAVTHCVRSVSTETDRRVNRSESVLLSSMVPEATATKSRTALRHSRHPRKPSQLTVLEKRSMKLNGRYEQLKSAWLRRARNKALTLVLEEMRSLDTQAPSLPASMTLTEDPPSENGQIEVTAAIRALSTVNGSRKRKRQANDDLSPAEGTPAERKLDDIPMLAPGAYINEPRAVQLRQERRRKRGRPRKGGPPPRLLFTVKSSRLYDLPGFIPTETALPPTASESRPLDRVDDIVSIGNMDRMEDRVTALTQEILSLSRPGVYVNEPRAVMAYRDQSARIGRPKEACIVTFKSFRLREMAWFVKKVPTDVPSESILGSVKDVHGAYLQSEHTETDPSDTHIDPSNDATINHTSSVLGDDDADRTRSTSKETAAKARPRRSGLGVPLTVDGDTDADNYRQGHRTLLDDSNDSMIAAPVSQQTYSNDSSSLKDVVRNGQSTEDVASDRPSHQSSVDNTISQEGKSSQVDIAAELPESVQHTQGPKVNDDSSQMARQEGLETPKSSVRTTSALVPAGLAMFDMVNQSGLRRYRAASKRQGVTRSGGVVDHQRARIVLDILSQCNGVFPGSDELFYPFSSRWRQLFGQLPDRKTLERCLAHVIATGKVTKVTFSFMTSEGFSVTRHILTEPTIHPQGDLVKELQQEMQNSWPGYYLPPGVPLDEELRQSLQDRTRLTLTDARTQRRFRTLQEKKAPRNLTRPKFDVQLGMTEKQIAEGAERRRRQREMEDLYLYDDDFDEEMLPMVSEFQLDSYKFVPEDSRVNRGPSGRSRLASVLHFASADKPVRGPSIGTLKDLKERLRAAKVLRANSKRISPPPIATLSPSDTTGLESGTTQSITLVDPQQPFHHTSGTFATIPTPGTAALVQAGTSQTEPSGRPILREAEGYTALQPSKAVTAKGENVVDPSVNISGDHGKTRTVRDRMVGYVRYGSYATRESKKRALPQDQIDDEAEEQGEEKSIFYRRRPRPWTVTDAQGNSKRIKRNPLSSMTGFDIRDPVDDIPMTIRDQSRLLYAISVVKTLTGGLQQGRRTINFAIVNQAMHFKFDGKYCREHWNHIKVKHHNFVDRMQERFRRLFLDAYQRKEIPEMNMSTPEKIDWAYLVDWAQSKLSRDAASMSMLPDTREEFDADFIIDVSEGIYSPDQEGFFASNVSSVRKEEIINTYAYFEPLSPTFQERNAKNKPNHDLLVESWIRANVMTPTKGYDSTEAFAKLTSVCSDNHLQACIDLMLGERIIKGANNSKRNMPGRNFILGEPLEITFPLPWQWDSELFVKAANFKVKLDKAFKKSGTYELRADAPNSNAESMVIINLAEHDLVEVDVALPPTDHSLDADKGDRLTKWGFTQGNYKTMFLDKGRLAFPIRVSPTPSYIFGLLHAEGFTALNDTGGPLLRVPLPLSKTFEEDGSRGARLPFWSSIHGALIPDKFSSLLLTLLYLLAQRPGIDATHVSRTLKGRYWAWEIDLLAEWGRDSGLVRADGRGWELGEWWWLVGAAIKGAIEGAVVAE